MRPLQFLFILGVTLVSLASIVVPMGAVMVLGNGAVILAGQRFGALAALGAGACMLLLMGHVAIWWNGIFGRPGFLAWVRRTDRRLGCAAA